ncbi:MAG: 30S ribosomal protein S16 [Chloroflexi bacterium]|nr:30S ribosomal protein S16 [Chloroflexota bacterium]
MVRIRLRRMGLKKQPSYRIVVVNQRTARGGEYIENIGHHNPRTEPPTDVLDEERALYWLSVGAQPSEAVASIMRRTGTLARYERLRKGETMEALLQDAAAAKASAEPVSQKTRRPSPAAGQGRKAAAEEAAS